MHKINVLNEIFLTLSAGAHLQHVYFESECFEHFHYISQLVKDCRSRVDKVRKTPDDETMWDCEVMIRLSYVGKLDVSIPIQKALQGGKFIGRVKYIFLPRN